MRSIPVALALSIIASLPVVGQIEVPPTHLDSVSYIIGQYYAGSIRKQASTDGIDLDAGMLSLGFNEAMAGSGRFNDAQMQDVMSRFEEKLQQERESRAAKQAAANDSAGAKFLAENRAKPGVVELPSGLQYRIIAPGTGKAPALNDNVSVLYTGRLIDGTVFDSSTDPNNPATFSVSGVIAGWTEALQKMKTGAKWELYIPGKLAYGVNPPPGGPIEPNSLLIFEVQLLGINAGQ